MCWKVDSGQYYQRERMLPQNGMRIASDEDDGGVEAKFVNKSVRNERDDTQVVELICFNTPPIPTI